MAIAVRSLRCSNTVQTPLSGGTTTLEAGQPWPQPWTVVLPNEGMYRVDFTGDISDTRFFELGDLEFSISEAAVPAVSGQSLLPPPDKRYLDRARAGAPAAA